MATQSSIIYKTESYWQTEKNKMSSDQRKRLQKMIDTLMLSYNENQDIEHISEMKIPAKESIINLT